MVRFVRGQDGAEGAGLDFSGCVPYNGPMPMPILATKLYIPPPRPQVVPRSRLVERLNEGLSARHKLTLISAPAGFGKTTLLSEWVARCGRAVAWLSLDEGDSDPARFLTYLIAALRTLALSCVRGERGVGGERGGGDAANIGAGVLGALQSPQPPPTESVLTALINEITALPGPFALVLDDYHAIEAKPVGAATPVDAPAAVDAPAGVDAPTSVDGALTYLLEHLPPQMHLVIATREDPDLPLARLRARNQLTELRAADLRFTPAEAAGFLNQVMGLDLSPQEIAALEARTEGWIAGLQLAALALQGTISTPGQRDAAGFIRSFSGSHHFVLDYLVEEVLHQQSEEVQAFLLRTSILDRLCGSLCDAVLHGDADPHPTPSASGQATLEYLERANLFIVPLDNERRWYRYHHLFAELLRQRLQQRLPQQGDHAAPYHIRASQWYEDHGLEIEAFHHAVAAHDVERAERLIEGKGTLLHFRGAVAPVLSWLESLPKAVLDAHPSLWTTYASVLLVSGQKTVAEQKLESAEAALRDAEALPSHAGGAANGAAAGTADGAAKTRDTIGRIAAIRATMAVNQDQAGTIIALSQRALEYLAPDNLSFRTFTIWKLGYAYHLQGDRDAAMRAYSEAISISEASGNTITIIAATLGLADLQAQGHQLHLAAQSYRRVLQLFGDRPLPLANLAHLGLAQICYEWNDLGAAEQHALQSVQLARQAEDTGRFVICEAFLARVKLAQGDLAGAATMLAETERSARQHDLQRWLPEVAAAQVLVLLRQGDPAAAARLAQAHDLPLSRARALLAQGDPSAALAALEPRRQQVEAKGRPDERLEVLVLRAVALRAHGEKDEAVRLLGEALALAEPGGSIRLFLDEGLPMARLLAEAAARGVMPGYIAKLLSAFDAEGQPVPAGLASGSGKSEGKPAVQPLIEPLSPRELQVLQLVAQGLSNREIGERLYLALDTVKGHNRRIYDKLQVASRTEAIARARELGLL